MGVRKSSGLVNLVAALTPVQVWPTQAAAVGIGGRKAKIRKLLIANRAGALTHVHIGYVTLAGVFTQVCPDIACANGQDVELRETEIPLMGNSPATVALPAGGLGAGADGFIADTTPLVGTNGFIWAEATVAGAAAASVQVLAEVEEE